MKLESLQDLFIEQLRDLYSAETQLTKALPKMAKTASSDELRNAFEEHLEVTRQHVSRLEQVFQELGENPKGQKCKGMEGLIEEGDGAIKDDMEEAVRDAALIAAAQRVEHYEIAGYGTVRTYAQLLGREQVADLLQETLNEEGEADKTLTGLAESINVEAEGDAGSQDQEQEQRRPGKKSPGRTGASAARRRAN